MSGTTKYFHTGQFFPIWHQSTVFENKKAKLHNLLVPNGIGQKNGSLLLGNVVEQQGFSSFFDIFLHISKNPVCYKQTLCHGTTSEISNLL